MCSATSDEMILRLIAKKAASLQIKPMCKRTPLNLISLTKQKVSATAVTMSHTDHYSAPGHSSRPIAMT